QLSPPYNTLLLMGVILHVLKYRTAITSETPTHPPLVSQEKTHLSQSVSEQDVSWGEKVSSRVSVHCCDGGCFFTRVWEGG
ncbi:hypothetical protein JOQ06_028825, partial [Pogonophryne albipinna]